MLDAEPVVLPARLRGCTPAHTSIPAASWEEFARIIGSSLRNVLPSSIRASTVSTGIVHIVPPSLQHIGCMWLEEGDERQRCGHAPAWTMGNGFCNPRLYCEEHGQLIYLRTKGLGRHVRSPVRS